jgi:pimeloyl-[acyl-carrier protein] synthase
METTFSLNFTNPDFIQNPYKYYEELYAHDSILFDTNVKSWLAFNYDDVKAVLENKLLPLGKKSPDEMDEFQWNDIFKIKDLNQKNVLLQKKANLFVSTAFMVDKDEHFEIKKEIMKVFTPQLLEELAMNINKTAEECLKPYKSGQTINLQDDYIYPIVRSAVEYLFGMEKGKAKSLIENAQYAQKQFHYSKGVKEKLLITQAVIYVANYTLKTAEDDSAPRGPLLKKLISLYKSGLLNADGLVSNTVIIMGAALETTFSSIESLLYNFHKNRNLYHQVRRDRSLIKKFIAESNRLESATSFVNRYAPEDAQIRGVDIKKGDKIICLLGAANRDPKKFTNANEIDFERSNENHLVFGSGAHFCIGAAVAKIEMEVALKNFMDKFNNFEIVSELNWGHDFRFRSLQTLEISV